MYKLSKYTSYKAYGDNIVLFNSISSALLELDKTYSDKFKNFITTGELDIEFKENLLKGKFICNSDLDETNLLNHAYNKVRYKNTSLSLTIAPTLTCNFKCPYCYEEGFRENTMTESTQNNLLEFIEDYLKLGVKHLSIVWYGGEPLLKLNIIENLTYRIFELLKTYNATYDASMVSNGYLLTKDVALKLNKLKINSVQITLDGPKEVHDTRRMLVNNKGSFETIIKNITEIADLIYVIIRINIDKTNISSVDDILNELIKHSLQKKVKIYPAKIDSINNTDLTFNCIETKDFSEFGIEFFKKALNYGFKSFSLPNCRFNVCGACTDNAYVVDPQGYLFKCWNTIGRENYRIGHINKKRHSKISCNNNLLIFMNYTPFNEDCKKCDVLPLCMGGCPYHKIKTNHNNCLEYKYNLEKILDLYYCNYKKNLKSEAIFNEF